MPFDYDNCVYLKPDKKTVDERRPQGASQTQQQTPAQPPDAPAKPVSKLAAMAAARRQQQQPQSQQPQQTQSQNDPPAFTSPTSNPSDAPSKPLSKLQSRALQARAPPPPVQPPPPPRELTQSEKLFVDLDTTIEKSQPSSVGNVIVMATARPREHALSSSTANLWICQKGAFDGPSPDDIVLSARKGTTLGSGSGDADRGAS